MPDMPQLATYNEVASYLGKPVKTIYNMVTRKAFKPGIYIGDGRFNMTRLKDAIEKGGGYLRRPRQKPQKIASLSHYE